jgi:hypothetical protein
MRGRLSPAVSIVALVFALSGCQLIPRDLIGTWTRNDAGNIETVSFEGKSISLSQTSPAGSISFSVEAADSEARHIDSTVTGSAGAFSGYTTGQVYYWYYELNPDGLYFMYAPVAYPPAVSSGPFTPVP